MRILFVEDGLGVGGSVISLHYLLRGLVAQGVEAVVSFPAPHAWSDRFTGLGIEVRYENPGAAAPDGLAAPDAAGPAASGAPNPPAAPTAEPPAWKRHPAYRALSFHRRHLRDHPAAVRRWRRAIGQVRPDAVYGNNGVPLNLALLEAAGAAGLPAWCHLRGLQPLRRPHRRAAKWLARGIAISETVRRHYLDAGFPPERIVTVHNGIDPGDYPYRDPAASIPGSGGRLLFLGRLAGWKGADVLLAAVARLAERRPQLTLLVAGDGPARADWERRAAEAGLSQRVTFAGFRPDVRPLLAEADLLVHASTEPEPFGRVLLEGMAAGVPVIASALGATPEIIEDGRSGSLVPAGDPAALADRIDDLLAAGDRRVAMARAARRRVEAAFSVESMVEGVVRVLAAGPASPVDSAAARRAGPP